MATWKETCMDTATGSFQKAAHLDKQLQSDHSILRIVTQAQKVQRALTIAGGLVDEIRVHV
eukprot:scaffold198540_cov29-Tisochrysis_lutea.AAC.3